MKIVTVVGARPQFIKAATVSRQISQTADIEELIIHTGQHFDENMSRVFFDELQIPEPNYNLDINSLHHGAMTGRMLEGIEEILLNECPDWMLVYGDTNSTIAGALAAKKLNVKVAHVEAGLRSFNNRMPEEINRVLTDRISDLLFCPSNVSAEHLSAEGINKGVHVVGDVMYDALLFYREMSDVKSKILQTLNVKPNTFYVATIHRAETTDNANTLSGVLEGLSQIGTQIVLPLHPRTKHRLTQFDLALPENIVVTEPLPYLDMVQLVSNSIAVLTDSGGLQKEAVWLGKRCFTLREETEWTELVDIGWNQLVGTCPIKILKAVNSAPPAGEPMNVYGDGQAAARVIEIIRNASE